MKTETLSGRKTGRMAATTGRRTNRDGSSLKIRNVLVPLDFSVASHAAIRFAAPLLKRFGANLQLVHVLPNEAPMAGLADLPIVIPELELARRMRRDLQHASDIHSIRTQPGSMHVRRGVAFVEICALARRKEIDLIVIATRGMTGLKRVLLGSTAERVVRYSPCPVLVIHPHDSKDAFRGNGHGPARLPIRKILVPIDFSEPSARNLSYATRVAKELGATLVLLHSIALQYFITGDEYARYDFPLLMQRGEEFAKQQMRQVLAKLRKEGIQAESSLQIGHAGGQICARAIAERADLIVTGTHGRTGLKHVLLGSTAEYVVRHAKTPVLVVPSHDRPIPR